MRVFVPVSCRTEKCKKLGTKGTLVLVAKEHKMAYFITQKFVTVNRIC